jgi:hypothetical protein
VVFDYPSPTTNWASAFDASYFCRLRRRTSGFADYGFVESCRAFYEAPRVDRSGEDRVEPLVSQVAALAAARRTFGAERARVPTRSRSGAKK